jgi:hypothetical protein
MNAALRAAAVPATILLVVALPTPAHAYLDPQTGSMIVSAVVAFVATIAMGIQSYWHRIVALFRREAPTPIDPDRPEEDSPEA